MKIKVCGITQMEQLEQLQNLKIDFAGLIFYKGSKRFVGDKLVQHKSEIRNLNIQTVGVFVNEEVEMIEETVAEYGLDYVQLHGDESVHLCKQVEAFIPVIKALQISPDIKIEQQLHNYRDACTYFLFDTASTQYGGTGKLFDWRLLESIPMSKPFFLSGGIGLEELETLKQFKHPEFFTADLNSKFEIEAGIKDMNKVGAFINAIN